MNNEISDLGISLGLHMEYILGKSKRKIQLLCAPEAESGVFKISIPDTFCLNKWKFVLTSNYSLLTSNGCGRLL